MVKLVAEATMNTLDATVPVATDGLADQAAI
jgi:hypothetical protein